MSVTHERQLDAPLATYDQSSIERDGTIQVTRTRDISSWKILVAMFFVFVVLCLTTGIRCATDDSCAIVDEVKTCGGSANLTCTVYQVPSLGTLLNNGATSTLSVVALSVLVAMHILLTVNVSLMIVSYSWLPVGVMMLAVAGMYVFFYVSLIVAQWYISICAMIALALWCVAVCVGLRRYYLRQPSKPLYWISVASLSAYVICMLLYIAFSPIPYQLVGSKDLVILLVQLGMAVSCVIFVVALAFHTRCISYAALVERTFVAFI
jgi:hypothetical protein